MIKHLMKFMIIIYIIKLKICDTIAEKLHIKLHLIDVNICYSNYIIILMILIDLDWSLIRDQLCTE